MTCDLKGVHVVFLDSQLDPTLFNMTTCDKLLVHANIEKCPWHGPICFTL